MADVLTPGQPKTDPPDSPEPSGASLASPTTTETAVAEPPAPPAPPAPPVPADPGAPPPGEPPEPETDEDDDGGSGGKMSFLDHLDELRRRLIRSFIALGVGVLVCYGFIDPIFDFIMEPLAAVLPPDQGLIYTDPTEAFFLRLKMAALVGLVLSTPVVMTQFWLFVAPGLYAHEKKFAIPFIALATFFFVAGVVFAHYVLFPVAWGFFASYGAADEYVEFTPRLEPAFSLYVRLVLGCGVVFQLPTVVFFLARMGVASPKFLLRNFKYAVLLIFIFAAVITPTPDPVTMTFMAGPMLALYVLSIGIAWVFRKRGTDTEDDD